MFTLHDTPIDPEALKAQVTDPHCGAFVCFEGWVRNHNEGKQVLRLDYEAYAAVAVSEGNRIVQAACERFGVTRAVCAHRVGALALGDLAVWVGVASPHRAEAFEACRYIIDTIKHHVPIWKKEFYTDGDSGWVNCERCAAEGHDHDHAKVDEAAYYARQQCLPEVGAAGQQRLRDARVLVIGAGGLGCGVLPSLVSAGVGTVGICDSDVVSLDNLHRQPLYTVADVGKPKVARAVACLHARNPNVTLRAHAEFLTLENAPGIIADYDLLIDCTDNFETKHLLNELAVRHAKRLIQASIYQYEGQLFAYDPAENAACLQCLWPETPAPGCVGACADVGVLGAVPSVFGALQAAEALKQILGLPGRLSGAMLFMDLLSLRVRRVPIARAATCPVCGTTPQPVVAEGAPIEVRLAALTAETLDGYLLVDIREAQEVEAAPLTGVPHVSWPASQLDAGPMPFPPEARYLFCCSHGRRSKYLAMQLRREGYAGAFSLAGGLRGLVQPARGR
jgi:molybdopterin/thiamine biosynthesis adenylyltransferase/molybdopterin synthase catalytic subunit/rhodanese-related sulfurtransferase